MLIEFACPNCGTKLEADATTIGTSLACPQCQGTLTVPRVPVGPGATIGGFKLIRLLGKGGMGEVYLGQQLSMDRPVALKILPVSLTEQRELTERFLNEVQLAARLEHPNIVTAYAAGQDAGVHFLAMAYVKGESLEARLKREKVLPEPEALCLTRKIARALAYAWEQHRLLHRDIKPANILLGQDGEPKLADMGLSKSLVRDTGMTLSGMVMGTPNYMSPEQAEGLQGMDFRTDMYALGATLYHMVTGQMPFQGSSLMETLRKQVSEALPDPQMLNPALSDGCAALMESMLAKQPERRYASWAALIEDLDRVTGGASPSQAPLAPGQSCMLRSHADRAKKPMHIRHSKLVRARNAIAAQNAGGKVAPGSKRVVLVSSAVGVSVLLAVVGGVALLSRNAPTVGPAPPAQVKPASPPATTATLPSIPPAAPVPERDRQDHILKQQSDEAVQGAAANATVKAGAEERGKDDRAGAGGTTIGASGTELLADPGFEAFDSILSPGKSRDRVGWTGNGGSFKRFRTVQRTGNASAYSGNRKLICDGASQSIKQALISNGPGAYTVSAWLKLDAGSDPGRIQIGLQVGTNEMTYAAVTGTGRISAEGWAQVSGTLNLAWTGTLADAYFFVNTLTSLVGFYVDDCSLQKVASVAKPTLAPNGGKEAVATHPALDALAASLLQQDFQSVRSAIAATNAPGLPEEWSGIRAEVAEVIRMPEIILEAFRAATGKELAIGLKTGVEKLRIKEVTADQVIAERLVRSQEKVVGTVARVIAGSDLSLAERFLRLGQDKTPARQIMRGLLAYEAGTADKARQLFVDAGSPLGALLDDHLARNAAVRGSTAQARKQAATAVEAQQRYRALLATAGCATPEADLDALVLEIRQRKFGDIQVAKVQREVAAFTAEYADTDVGRKNRRLLHVLGLIRPNIPLHVDQAVVDAALAKLKAANPVGDSTPKLTIGDDGITMDFSTQKNLMDISALAGLPIVRLSIWGTQVRDLKPLRGMPLRVFSCGHCDLSGLDGLPLTDFSYDGFYTQSDNIPDLDWMKGMPLTNIFIKSGEGVLNGSLTPLAGMRITTLRIFTKVPNGVSNLSPLKGLPLSELEIASTGWQARGELKSIAALAGMKLKSLSLAWSQISDLSPLANMPLEYLDLTGTDVQDLTPLRGLPLKVLKLNSTRVRDLHPLAGLPLESLDVRGTKITDFSALKDIPTLKNVER